MNAHKRQRRTYHTHAIDCEYCETVFYSSRKHKRTCSPKCRKAMSRWVAALEQEAEEKRKRKKKNALRRRNAAKV